MTAVATAAIRQHRSSEDVYGNNPKCRVCGTIGYPEDKYCANCGTGLYDGCKHCGAPIEHPIAHYCTNCGHDLREERGKS